MMTLTRHTMMLSSSLRHVPDCLPLPPRPAQLAAREEAEERAAAQRRAERRAALERAAAQSRHSAKLATADAQIAQLRASLAQQQLEVTDLTKLPPSPSASPTPSPTTG
eukprot:COSAG01_NODE_2749_length_7147_cov_21.077185_7_plen_109_part_00